MQASIPEVVLDSPASVIDVRVDAEWIGTFPTSMGDAALTDMKTRFNEYVTVVEASVPPAGGWTLAGGLICVSCNNDPFSSREAAGAVGPRP